MKSNKGFTLLEVLIVLFILATLTVLSNQSIQQAIRNKVKIQRTVDEMSQVRDALRIIERDINLAYHNRDLEKEINQLVKEQNKPKRPAGAPPPPPSLPDPDDPFSDPNTNRLSPETEFIGTNEAMSFATLNSGRLMSGAQQADFLKVGYSIRNCRKPGSEGQSFKCLARRSSPILEGDIEKGGEEIILLEGVSEFKLRYFGHGKQDYVSDWNSKTGDISVKGKYPDAVEVSLTITPDENQKREISMQLVIPVRFANNPEPKNNTQRSQP